ncbi:hypothetical protein SAY86_030528 [Trapa natans]|uniref:Uncharacterized protein n=1 Tax=Trapa natans TaxID=22666 RepID=A0AAN7MG62_TRANT|nr:hypothetical protein SAY86_030528 [Trapa natans]
MLGPPLYEVIEEVKKAAVDKIELGDLVSGLCSTDNSNLLSLSSTFYLEWRARFLQRSSASARVDFTKRGWPLWEESASPEVRRIVLLSRTSLALRSKSTTKRRMRFLSLGGW